MKARHTLFIFFISLHIYAQQNPLQIEPIWKLVGFQIDGQTFTAPNSNNPYSIKFLETSFETKGECNTGQGNYTIEEGDELSISEYGRTLSFCTEMDNEYMRFFDVPENTTFTYEATNLLSTGGASLVIYKSNGDSAMFKEDENLSTNNNTLKSVSIYPSIVDDSLFVTNAKNLTNVTIKIFNLNGIALYSINDFTLTSKSLINLEHLKSGLYILSIKDESRSAFVKKFIKK